MHLQAAAGWLELGNHLEANAELDKIAPTFRKHTDVLEFRWKMCAKEKKWIMCEDIARAIIRADPYLPSGWLYEAETLRHQGKLKEAYSKLYVVFNDFPDSWRVPYNLARYSSLLGEYKEAAKWFERAFAIDRETVRVHGSDHPDLRPMWDNFHTLLEDKDVTH
jgi:tetratricopeptide (TPR) repeat protein